jgi:hypothetical protein
MLAHMLGFVRAILALTIPILMLAGGLSATEAQAKTASPIEVQIDDYKDKALVRHGWTESEARRLPIGQEVCFDNNDPAACYKLDGKQLTSVWSAAKMFASNKDAFVAAVSAAPQVPSPVVQPPLATLSDDGRATPAELAKRAENEEANGKLWLQMILLGFTALLIVVVGSYLATMLREHQRTRRRIRRLPSSTASSRFAGVTSANMFL